MELCGDSSLSLKTGDFSLDELKKGNSGYISRCLGLSNLGLAAAFIPCKDYEDQQYEDNDDHYEPVNCTKNECC